MNPSDLEAYQDIDSNLNVLDLLTDVLCSMAETIAMVSPEYVREEIRIPKMRRWKQLNKNVPFKRIEGHTIDKFVPFPHLAVSPSTRKLKRLEKRRVQRATISTAITEPEIQLVFTESPQIVHKYEQDIKELKELLSNQSTIITDIRNPKPPTYLSDSQPEPLEPIKLKRKKSLPVEALGF